MVHSGERLKTMLYRVSFLVAPQALTLVMGVLQNDPSITLESCEQVAEKPPAKRVVKHHGFRNGQKMKGISGKDLVLELTASGLLIQLSAIQRAFDERGFAPSSHSSALATALKQGLIVREKDGYRRTPLVIKHT